MHTTSSSERAGLNHTIIQFLSHTVLLFIQTKVRKSRIHGLGLFADQFIPKGTVIWKFTPGFDLRFSREQVLGFPRILQVYMSTYAWKSRKSGLYCFASDNNKYCNHSFTPNALSEYKEDEDEVVTTALRDIHKGEEITENYGGFEDQYDPDNILDTLEQEFTKGDIPVISRGDKLDSVVHSSLPPT